MIIHDLALAAREYRNATQAKSSGIPFTPADSTIDETGRVLDALISAAENFPDVGNRVKMNRAKVTYTGTILGFSVRLDIEETRLIDGSEAIKWRHGYTQWLDIDGEIEKLAPNSVITEPVPLPGPLPAPELPTPDKHE